MSNVRGCVENSLRESSRIFAGMAINPSPSVFSSLILVISVDSRSEAVISNSLSDRLKRKQSSIGRVFFELITLLMA